jgi:hypothetical protein
MAQEDIDEETEGVKAPSEFKTGNKWKPFKEGCIAFFNTNLGMDQVPFSNVICPDTAPGDPQEIYLNEHSRLIAITPHQGLEFDTDNGRVFDSSHGHWMVQLGLGYVPLIQLEMGKQHG